MNGAERARHRRCFALRVAAFFGVLFALFSAAERAWGPVGVAIAGTVLLVVVYRRDCRGTRRGPS